MPVIAYLGGTRVAQNDGVLNCVEVQPNQSIRLVLTNELHLGCISQEQQDKMKNEKDLLVPTSQLSVFNNKVAYLF